MRREEAVYTLEQLTCLQISVKKFVKYPFPRLSELYHKFYAVLKHDTKNQNTDGKYSAQVMYASSVKDFCPVAALRLMISKTEPEATSLFNRHIKGKIKSRCEGIDLEKNLWYSSESLGKGYFTNFLTDIKQS
jgi:hypothetical protein